jgi:hypothetical protein
MMMAAGGTGGSPLQHGDAERQGRIGIEQTLVSWRMQMRNGLVAHCVVLMLARHVS